MAIAQEKRENCYLDKEEGREGAISSNTNTWKKEINHAAVPRDIPGSVKGGHSSVNPRVEGDGLLKP